MTFAKSEALRSLYSYYKSKIQVVQEQKTQKIYKITHTWLAQKGKYQTLMADVPGSILIGGNICCYFHMGKPLMPVLPSSCVCEKPELRIIHEFSSFFVEGLGKGQRMS